MVPYFCLYCPCNIKRLSNGKCEDRYLVGSEINSKFIETHVSYVRMLCDLHYGDAEWDALEDGEYTRWAEWQID